jgi:hypothetical protein
MKKAFCLLMMLLCVKMANGQSVNGVNLKDIDTPYLLIMGVGKLFSPKVSVEVDFGQKVSSKLFKDSKEVKILDENGKLVEFNSMVEALNFFTIYNYEFVNAYAISVNSMTGGTQNVYHYLMKKKE